MHRSVGIERRIESHSRSHTNTLNLPNLIDSRLHGMPSELRHRSVGLGIYPSFVDSMSKGISIDGCGRSFEVCVVSVEQLVPETIMMLHACQSSEMASEEVQDLIALGMVLRQNIQDLTHCKHSPSVGPSPEERRMVGHILHPSMAEESHFWHKHFLFKQEYLFSRFIKKTRVFGLLSPICQCRHPHEHIVEPNGVLMRSQSSECSITEPVFLIHNVADVIIDERFEVLIYSDVLCFNHRTAYGSCVVECMGFNHSPDVDINFLTFAVDLFEERHDIRQQRMAFGDIIHISFVARGLISRNHG